MDTKIRPLYILSTRDPPQNKGHIQTESKGLEKDISHKWRLKKKKKAGVAILISDKIDFKIKAVKRDKEGHFIMIKGSIQEEDITIINIYTSNIGALQYVRLLLLGHFSHVRLCVTPLDSRPPGSPIPGILQARVLEWGAIAFSEYVRQMLTSMKGKINNNTLIVRDFNTSLTTMDRSTKQKINKETQTLNDTMDQLDLIDIYRTFTPKR